MTRQLHVPHVESRCRITVFRMAQLPPCIAIIYVRSSKPGHLTSEVLDLYKIVLIENQQSQRLRGHRHLACSIAGLFDEYSIMGEPTSTNNGPDTNGTLPKKILINAFDMSTVGHLSPGQWKNPKDKSATKRRLDYWIDLAKLLERGGINALFLADTYGGYDTYEDSLDNCIRRAAQWPMTDPTIPISAMAAVTKNLAFAITASTSFEPPFLLAKRFSTLDHLTGGRFGWNIVTSWKKAAFKAIGLDNPIEHDERYAQADEYLRVLYK